MLYMQRKASPAISGAPLRLAMNMPAELNALDFDEFASLG